MKGSGEKMQIKDLILVNDRAEDVLGRLTGLNELVERMIENDWFEIGNLTEKLSTEEDRDTLERELSICCSSDFSKTIKVLKSKINRTESLLRLIQIESERSLEFINFLYQQEREKMILSLL